MSEHTIIPAQAGWFVAMFIKAGEDHPAGLELEPIHRRELLEDAEEAAR